MPSHHMWIRATKKICTVAVVYMENISKGSFSDLFIQRRKHIIVVVMLYWFLALLTQEVSFQFCSACKLEQFFPEIRMAHLSQFKPFKLGSSLNIGLQKRITCQYWWNVTSVFYTEGQGCCCRQSRRKNSFSFIYI